MREAPEGIGDRGEKVPGPPWILGQRGSPLEAPENSMASLRRALALGLDGVAYDVRACRSGELVLLHDPTLDRTTDAHGRLAEKSLVELSSLDAGGWFGARFKGERLALFEEALALGGDPERGLPQHMVVIQERGLVSEVARSLAEYGPKLSVRVASAVRDVCLEARDAGLSAMLIGETAGDRDRTFVREEKLAAYALPPSAWRADDGQAEWPCERWSWSVDDPADLLEACRVPLSGFNTNEPLRALATRALVHLTPHDGGLYPVEVPVLDVMPGGFTAAVGGRGDWCGSWSTSARVRNPFPFVVRVTTGVIPRHGAFEIELLPASFELAPGETHVLPFTITGGSWRPGGDPLFFAHYRWKKGPGRTSGSLLLDAPLKRTRTAVADVIARRLTMLRESPGEAEASMTLRRHRHHLLVSIESSAGWKDARTLVNLDGRFHYGGRGVRLNLPVDFDRRELGVPFSCGMQAMVDGEWRVRRWSGGIPDELGSGALGRLLPLKQS